MPFPRIASARQNDLGETWLFFECGYEKDWDNCHVHFVPDSPMQPSLCKMHRGKVSSRRAKQREKEEQSAAAFARAYPEEAARFAQGHERMMRAWLSLRYDDPLSTQLSLPALPDDEKPGIGFGLAAHATFKE